MNDERKTKAQLAEELADLRLQVADLKQREARAAEAEEAPHESGRFLQAILDGIEDGITVRDRDFTILQVNRWIEQMFAHEMPLVGKKCYRAFEQREEACPWCPAIKAMETGNVFSQVVSVPVAGGMTRWFELTAFPFRDAQGDIVGAIEHVKDITDRRAAEEALRKASEEKSLILSSVSEEVVYHDRDMGIVWTNRAAGESSGLTPEQLVGRMCYEVWHGRNQVCDGCPVQKAMDTGSPAETETTTPDGRVWHVHGYPVFGDGGKVIGTVEVVRGITAHKAAEEALRKAAEEKSLILSSVSEQVIYHDRDMVIVWANRAAGEAAGLTPEQLVGRMCYEVWHGRNQVCDGCPAQKAMDTGAPAETEITTPDGRAWHVHGYPVFGNGGKVIGAVEVVRDISERKAAEEALRRSEEDYRLLFEQSVDGIVVVADTRIVRANQACADIHGWSVEELIGMTSTDLLHPDERAAAAERIRGVIDRTLDRSNARQYHALRADGSIALVEYRSRRILWKGRPAVQAIVRDITEQVRLEEELRQALKMEAVGQLAGGIAHDFNNLMTGILCHANLLKSESPSPEDIREAADLIEGAARRAAELTSQLLGFARRGKQRDVPVDLNATTRTSVRLLGRSLDPRIRVRMPFRDEHAFVRGDPVQMEQVVLNLAMNARDAMPEGGEMTLTIHTLDVGAEDCKSRPGAEPGRYVALSVADTGCGIPEAMRSRVFEPFFTTKPHGKGTGMGLAMVYGIVKDHGGWVEVDSEPGRGTTFRVFLPAAEAPADAGATPADADLRAPPDAGRILVVDDEELVRNVVARMLSALGYEVATAANAREAVEYYKRFGRDVSVVIIDMAMPEMDGRRCFAALRGLDPDVKALLATGCGNEDRVQDALDEGMAGLVRKPFQTKQLAKAVKQALTQ